MLRVQVTRWDTFCLGIVIGAVVMLALAPACVKADEPLWLTYTARSYHFNREAGHNEAQQGWGGEVQFNRTWALGFGEYRNSQQRSSHYQGVIWTPWQPGNWKIGMLGGRVDGYLDSKNSSDPSSGEKYRAVFAPMVEYEYKGYGANVMIAPAVVALQLKVSIW